MSDDSPSARDRLEADRIDLLDLTLRNPLLNYRPRARGLEFVGESPADVFRRLVHDGKAQTITHVALAAPSPNLATEDGPPPLEADPPALHRAADNKLHVPLSNSELHDRLLSIFQAARTAIEEQGVNTLFLGLGLLDWVDDDRPLRAPLVLVPVELERFSARERFRLKHDGEDAGHNLSLAEKLRAAFGVTLPELAEPEDADLNAYFDEVAEAVAARPDWSVDRGACLLGFFSFGKFLMYRDLDESNWPADARPSEHPVVRALLGDGFHEPPSAFDDDPEEGRHAGPGDLSLVLDADGSQTLALRDVADGRNLVIQGPPGTGKSQTIANLIADAIGRGRRVLFVAEKLAALEVVKRRLDAAGLGDACLELHSQKTGKKAVLEQLRRALSAPRPPRLREAVGPSLGALVGRLDAYADAMNEPVGGTGLTPYQAAGELIQVRRSLANAPPLDIEGADDWSAEEYEARLELARRLQDRLAAVGPLREHPFHGARRSAWLPGDEEALRDHLRVAGHATAALREAAAALARFLRLPPPLSRGACDGLLRASRAVENAGRWAGAGVAGDWLERREDVRELLEDGRALADVHRRHDPDLLPNAWAEDLQGVRLALNTKGRRWWRWLSTEFIQSRARLASLCRGALPRNLDDQLRLIDAIDEARTLSDAIARHDLLAGRLFGVGWRGDRSDWPALAEVAEDLTGLQRDVQEGRLPRALLDFLAGPPALAGLGPLASAAGAARDALDAAVERVITFLDVDESLRFGDGGGLAALPFEELGALWGRWAAELPALDGLIALNRQVGLCQRDGLAPLAALADSWPGALVSLADAFRRARSEAVLRRAYADRPPLADFEPEAHDRALVAYREADRGELAATQATLARAQHARLPRGDGLGQLAVLRRELAKRARHLPVRQLMARAGLAIQAAKPVFLMSPLSVAAYLPPGGLHFDLVVFDEASQVRPVDALGALLRGRQAVVVGDSRQLPPSSFFDRLTAGDDRDDDEPTSEVESVLGLFLAAGAPERMLRWHYRSRHESLIEVSNREFYDGRLIVFPSPDAARGEAGLVLRHLPETSYDRGKTRTNPGEADAVARAVLAFAAGQVGLPRADRKTLGVATFSAAQAAAIVGRLDRLRLESPATESFFDPGAEEPFFIKNLENVQGDERDVIYISVGYGRTTDGSVSMNFGPLNAEGGERRLNVLITRARCRCEVFTNLTAEALEPGRSRSRGVEALRAFLAHARAEPAEVASLAAPAGSAFEAAVADAFRDLGHHVRCSASTEAGGISLAVSDPDRPGRYRLGIQVDGPGYLDAGPVRDRDRLRPQVLARLGWRLHHAWAPDWVACPELALRKALDALETPTTDVPLAAIKVEGPSDEEGAPAPDGATIYECARPNRDALGPDLTATPQEALADAVAEVVRVEGPVHATEVWRRIAEASGTRRVGPKVAEAIERATSRAVESGRARRAGDFLWPPGPETVEPRDRSALPATSRKPELIAPEELAEAALKIARDGYGIEPDALPAAAARLLGFPRINEDIRARLAEAVEALRRDGRLRESSGHLVAAAPSDLGPIQE